MPKVSILVPIYNVEKYLKEALDSLINQTLKDIEIICINDGSTDNSGKIIDEYSLKDNRIKVIHKSNSGYGATMNIGLDNATGEYIGVLEPDDFAKNTMFEDLYKLAKKDNLDLIKSEFYTYTSENNISRIAGIIKKQYVGKIFSVKDDLKFLGIKPSIWSAIYRREFLQENNIRFLETPGASFQDTSFAIKTFITAKRLSFTNQAYIYYRQDNTNASCKSKDKVYYICNEYEEIIKYINERPQLKQIVFGEIIATQFNTYRWNTLRISDEFRDEFIDLYQQIFQNYSNNNQIQKEFWTKAKIKELNLLLQDKTKFHEYINKLAKKNQEKQNRKNLFSIRINSSRISIILFGKQIIKRSF